LQERVLLSLAEFADLPDFVWLIVCHGIGKAKTSIAA
jgi:hypothetical protein